METRKVGEAPKLKPAYHGPFLVRRKVSEVDFLVQLDKDGNKQVIHYDKLKPYEGNHPTRWIRRAKKRFFANSISQQ